MDASPIPELHGSTLRSRHDTRLGLLELIVDVHAGHNPLVSEALTVALRVPDGQAPSVNGQGHAGEARRVRVVIGRHSYAPRVARCASVRLLR
jgi:hypothetical protein